MEVVLDGHVDKLVLVQRLYDVRSLTLQRLDDIMYVDFTVKA